MAETEKFTPEQDLDPKILLGELKDIDSWWEDFANRVAAKDGEVARFLSAGGFKLGVSGESLGEMRPEIAEVTGLPTDRYQDIYRPVDLEKREE